MSPNWDTVLPFTSYWAIDHLSPSHWPLSSVLAYNHSLHGYKRPFLFLLSLSLFSVEKRSPTLTFLQAFQTGYPVTCVFLVSRLKFAI